MYSYIVSLNKEACPINSFSIQAHDVVAHEVYGEEAVRITPPHSTASLTTPGDEVEGPNGECPEVWNKKMWERKYICLFFHFKTFNPFFDFVRKT